MSEMAPVSGLDEVKAGLANFRPLERKLISELLVGAAEKLDAGRPGIPGDLVEFLTNCVYTVDEHNPDEPVRKLPMDEKPYLREIVRLWQSKNLVRIEKSRQLMVSWLMAACHLHMVLAKPGKLVAWCSKKADDADAMLRQRLWHIYLHIPGEYAVPPGRYVQGRIEVYHNGSPIPTSQILAIPQGSEQLRQYTFSAIVSDEFAFQEHQEEAYAAARPTVDGGGKLTLISSANGRELFYKIGHEDL